MKKLFILSSIVLTVACNSGNEEVDTTASDSIGNFNTEAIHNDNPMRTLDTAQNIMEDTLNGRNIDTMKKEVPNPK